MANYKSNYTGEQIDSALGVLQGKGLDEVVGLVKRNSDGTFSAELLGDKADKSTTVTNVAYDSTNHKLTKTINDTTSDVVTIATLKTELGSMPASDVYEWAKAANKPTYTASEVSAVATSAVGSANGVAPLNASSKIDSTYLPSYVDDVVEYAGVSNFPATGESGIIYIDTTENKTYRWGGSSYVLIGGGSSGASPYSGTISAVTSGSAANGTENTFARGDHVHNLTKATIDALLVTTSSTEKFYREDGTWAIPPSSSGGGSSAPTLLGQTPYKLTEDTNVKLTASGSCSYTLESDTVADFDILNGTVNNATVYVEDNMYKIKASSSATAWYQAYVDIFVDGLTVGTTYNFCFDAVGCPNNSNTHTMIGHYILYDNNGSTLVTRGATDGSNLNTYAFQATTAKVKLRWYPSANSYFVAGTSVGNVNKIYIDRENETTHTDIVSSSGSFTDSAEIGQVAKGVTISTSPTASVYKMPASSGGASLPLEGKNVVVFGDSLIGMYRGETSATAHIANVTGATVYNVGFGGCRMSTHPTHGYAEFSMWALADAVATGTWTSQDAYASSGSDYFPEQLATLKSIDFNTVDYVVIHYGTNDFGGGVVIGASSASTDHSTLCGAARYSIEKLLTAYPKLRIFISLPVYRYWESGGTITYAETYTNSQNNKLYECVAALKTVAQEYNLPVIDGYYGLGINKVNASTFLLDGTHHNTVGRKRFGEFIGSKIIEDGEVNGGGTVTSIGISNASNGGLSISGSPVTSSGTITIGHSNVLASAPTTQAIYPIAIDKNGHITSYGTAVTPLTSASTLDATKLNGAVPATSLTNVTVTSSGSGNVVTGLSASNGTITYTLGSASASEIPIVRW